METFSEWLDDKVTDPQFREWLRSRPSIPPEKWQTIKVPPELEKKMWRDLEAHMAARYSRSKATW